MRNAAEHKDTLKSRGPTESFSVLSLGVGLNKDDLQKEIEDSQDYFDDFSEKDGSPLVLTNRRDLEQEFVFTMEKMEDNDEGDLQRSKSFCFDVENATDNLDAKSDDDDLLNE